MPVGIGGPGRRRGASFGSHLARKPGPRNPIWHRTDSADDLLPAWARLGPLSTTRPVKARVVQTVGRGRFRRDRSPNGVAERFPDWSAVGSRCPGPCS